MGIPLVVPGTGAQLPGLRLAAVWWRKSSDTDLHRFLGGLPDTTPRD